ncbi:MAG: lipid-binding SYLF domain-containing protein [Rhodospirillaceae bacterium]|nr:lipid-binding SYLF domain-containing protein [Rhodospirillaceae bacterium]
MSQTFSRRHTLNISLLALCATAAPAQADDVMDARHIMDEAAITVERVRQGQKTTATMDDFLRRSKGVLIIPKYYKASFIIGGSYGDGVLVKRQADASFGDPAFYRMTAGSLGLQAGMQSSEIVFMILTDKGLDAVLNDEFKLGANVGISVGSLGAGAEAATTTNVGNDIVAYSLNAGLFAGGSFEGAVIKPRKDWNAAVYGVNNDETRVIVERNQLQAAQTLKDALAKNVYPAQPGVQ